MRLIGRVPRAEVEDGRIVRLEDPPFHVLVSWVEGAPYAIEDACNHGGASLSEGERHGASVVCPMHGYRFDLATGSLLEPRGLCGDQRRLAARLEGGDIVVSDPGPEIVIVGRASPSDPER